MIEELQVSLFDLVVSLSSAIDLVSPVVAGHHKRVGYIAFSIAKELGLPLEKQNELLVAGMLHDWGALSLKTRLEALEFEIDEPHRHAEVSYLLLKGFEPFFEVASVVRFHHVPWRWGAGAQLRGEDVPESSHILHLADRVDVLINRDREILGQAKGIVEVIKHSTNRMFKPNIVKCIYELS